MQVRTKQQAVALALALTLGCVAISIVFDWLLMPAAAFAEVGYVSVVASLLAVPPVTIYFVLQTRRRVLLEDRLRALLDVDQTTGLATRRCFFRHFERSGFTNGVVMLVDLDRFKHINDTFGHAVGDRVLEHFGAEVRDFVSKNDLTCRMGGEEFLIFFRGMTLDQGMQRAQALAERLAMHPAKLTNGDEVVITMSAGVMQFTPGMEIDRAIAAADNAMYRAKEAGRNRVMRVNEADLVSSCDQASAKQMTAVATGRDAQMPEPPWDAADYDWAATRVRRRA